MLGVWRKVPESDARSVTPPLQSKPHDAFHGAILACAVYPHCSSAGPKHVAEFDMFCVTRCYVFSVTRCYVFSVTRCCAFLCYTMLHVLCYTCPCYTMLRVLCYTMLHEGIASKKHVAQTADQSAQTVERSTERSNKMAVSSIPMSNVL